MLLKRMRALRALLTTRRIDGVALIPGANLFYLTGLRKMLSERPYVLFVMGDRELHLVLPDFEAPEAESCLGSDVRLHNYNDVQGFSDAFRQAARELGLASARLGVEFTGMRLLEREQIVDAAPDIELVDADSLFAALRVRKDAAEIELMKAAARVNEQAILEVMRTTGAGRSERRMVADYQIAALQAGADALAFDPIIVAGPNGAFPHAHPTDRLVEVGDLVTMDCGTTLGGYCSDITRTFAVGEPGAELRAIYEAVRAANAVGRESARPGMTAQALDQTVRRVIGEAGYGEYFTHRTGHGLGLEVHEAPYIVDGNGLVLEPGMVFTIEPGIYVPGLGGVRIEDNVVITDDGCESLTELRRDLTVV